MYMKKKKRSWITVIAVFTAIIGAAVAVGTFLKKKAKTIGEQLDYEDSLYYDDEDDYEDSYSSSEPESGEEESDAGFFEGEESSEEDTSDGTDDSEEKEKE